MIKINSHNKGYTIAGILVSLGVLILILTAIGQMLVWRDQSQKEDLALEKGKALKTMFADILSGHDSWKNIYSAQENKDLFQCFLNGEDCTSISKPSYIPRSFVIKDTSNKIVFDPRKKNNGISPDGHPCTLYPSTVCPYRLETSAIALCIENDSCVNPALFIISKVVLSENLKILYSTQNTTIKIIKEIPPLTKEVVNDFCQKISGPQADPEKVFNLKTKLTQLGHLNVEKLYEDINEACENHK